MPTTIYQRPRAGVQRTTVDLPIRLYKRLKISAIERGVTVAEIVRHALARELGDPSLAEVPEDEAAAA